MLFASLEGKHIATLSGCIDSSTHHASGHFAEHRGWSMRCIRDTDLRTAGYAEGLAVAAGDVGAPFGGSAKHCERAGVGIDAE